MNPLLSWSNILKTFSISGGVFLDKPIVAKNVLGLKESFAVIESNTVQKVHISASITFYKTFYKNQKFQFNNIHRAQPKV